MGLQLTSYPLLSETIAYQAEDEAAALARYRGFAAALFERLYAAEPGLRGRFRFFRDPRTNDLWSICEPPGRAPFRVQLDPDCEVIGLGGQAGAWEIGTWAADPIEQAIAQIREYFLTDAPA